MGEVGENIEKTRSLSCRQLKGIGSKNRQRIIC